MTESVRSSKFKKSSFYTLLVIDALLRIRLPSYLFWHRLPRRWLHGCSSTHCKCTCKSWCRYLK